MVIIMTLKWNSPIALDLPWLLILLLTHWFLFYSGFLFDFLKLGALIYEHVAIWSYFPLVILLCSLFQPPPPPNVLLRAFSVGLSISNTVGS